MGVHFRKLLHPLCAENAPPLEILLKLGLFAKRKDQKPRRFLVFSFYPCGFSGFTILQNATGFYSSCALFAEKMHTEMHTKTGLLVRVKDSLQPLLDGIVI